jgi:hypothetical protein
MTNDHERRLRRRLDSGMCLTEACRAEGLTLGEARVALRMDSSMQYGVQRNDVAPKPRPVRSGLVGLALGVAALERADRHGEKVAKVEGQDLGAEQGPNNLKRAAAHAHAMSSWAGSMPTPEAHRTAAEAHAKVAEMHRAPR